MATLKVIRKRIQSVKNTRKITRAMKLVAAAKLRRAQDAIIAARPYSAALARVVSELSGVAGKEAHPLFEERPAKRATIVAITSDRGLAGGFNAQIVRRAIALAREAEADGQEVRWLAVGKKGRSTLRFRRFDVTQAWVDLTDRPTYHDAEAIAHAVADLYAEGGADRVVMVYNRFVSALTQHVESEVILPIPRTALDEEGEDRSAYEVALEGDFIYEPEPELILERLLPTYLETTIFRALLESAASEHGARMTAMRNASKNANDMIDRLTLEMNRARQAEITQEILEVVAGADALTS